jgi:isocitrate dehydrogenase kinase/phosphatase
MEGDDVIVEHCYIERRLRPLNLFLEEADKFSAMQAVIDYGQAIKDLARSNVFPGDLLLKNFGVTRHGRIIFYDYDELCLVTDCSFRDLPRPRFEEDEFRAEPWFYVGPHDIFPEQFINFLGMSPELRAAFLEHHADLMTADFWRDLKNCHQAEKLLEVVPYAQRSSKSGVDVAA